MLNLNGSLTKAGVPYSTLWSENFADEPFIQKLGQWLTEGQVTHDVSHVHAVRSAGRPRRAAEGRSRARSPPISAGARRSWASSTRAAWGCTTRSSPTSSCSRRRLQGTPVAVRPLRGLSRSLRGGGPRRLRLAGQERHDVPFRQGSERPSSPWRRSWISAGCTSPPPGSPRPSAARRSASSISRA